MCLLVVRRGRKDVGSADESASPPTSVESSCDCQRHCLGCSSPRTARWETPRWETPRCHREMFNRAPLLLWFSRWFRRGIWLSSTPSNANPTNPKLLIANNRISGSPLVVLLTKLTLCVILNLLVSSCSFLLLNRWIAKFITERRCDRVELDFHANRAIRMSIQSIAMHYMCFLFLSTDALNSLKMFSHSGWR